MRHPRLHTFDESVEDLFLAALGLYRPQFRRLHLGHTRRDAVCEPAFEVAAKPDADFTQGFSSYYPANDELGPNRLDLGGLLLEENLGLSASRCNSRSSSTPSRSASLPSRSGGRADGRLRGRPELRPAGYRPPGIRPPPTDAARMLDQLTN